MTAAFDSTSASGTASALLDVRDGQDRVMGDRALYLQLLRRFRHDYRASASTLRRSLDHGERDQARHLLHTVKGAAGMIGAHGLRDQAADLETALAETAPPFEQLDRFAATLDQLLAEIDGLLKQAPEPEAAPAQASEPDAALLQRLAYLLDMGDGAAIDVLEQSATLLAASLGLERFQQVTAAAHEFDFEAALAALTAGA